MLLSMKSLWALVLTVLSIASLAKSTPCYNINIPVTVSARNAALPPGLGLTDILSIVDALAGSVLTSLVSGTFNIGATFCEPEVNVPSRRNTLQLLVHGATYTRGYWFGDNLDERYSWATYASKQGYPTLSIDRLGNGASDRPDPILTVQYPLEMETIHQIILNIRAGSLPAANRAFSKIIYVGHSYGSIIGNALNTKYPADVNATILTGYSSSFYLAIPGVLAQADLLPAVLAEPDRFPGLNVGYLEISSKIGVRNLFWAGAYDSAVFEYDFANRGTLSAGEAATIAIAINTAAAYRNPVYIVTGQHDAIFCNLLAINLGGVLSSDCGDSVTGFLGRTRTLYPAARVFETYVVPNSGHCWQLHSAAYAAFGTVHNWMTRQGF